jgi:membrane protein DedA with SNARE-associated domain
MHQTLDFVLKHGYLFVFASVLAEQIGIPIPAVPVLLAMGALAGKGQMSYPAALALCVLAALSADLVWYALGRSRGSSILRLLCKISLEPDSCVRQTENVFLRYGARALLFAKFVPGLSTAFPPMAGNFRMPIWKFALFDGLGGLAWAASYSLIGMIFRNQINDVLEALLHFGSWVLAIVGGLLGLYILYKYIQRRRFYNKLRVARIEPHQLKEMMDGGQSVVIVDLRNSLEREDIPVKIPGAIALNFENIEVGLADVPLDQDVVLYCT